MKKQGFTLIEIIVCIALISLIGVGSVFGVRFVNNKIKISKLDQITDKAIEAAQIYLENNKKASNELYSNSNGVSVPLQLLVNEGLLNIDNTDLTIDDLKDEYVVTFLGGSGGTENCEQITSSASWANDKPIYLCMKSDGSSNLATIDPKNYGNLSNINKEPYYFRGQSVKNYIKYGENKYRILSVESDDSLILYSKDSFGSVFNGYTQSISKVDYYGNAVYCYNNAIPVISASPNASLTYELSINEYNGETYVDERDFVNATNCLSSFSISTWLSYYLDSRNDGYGQYYELKYAVNQRKIHLKSCMKITGGTGDFATPFILENKCNT